MNMRFQVLLTSTAVLFASPHAIADERRVLSLYDQFITLNAKAEALGAQRGAAIDVPSVLQCMHYQGIVRAETAGTPYFFITRSGNATITCPLVPDTPGELVVVRMGTRDSDGERLRSNRLALDSRINSTPPAAADRGVVSIPLDGTTQDGFGNTWPGWSHPGGCQLIDDVLVVPVEHNFTTGNKTDGGLLLIDVANPLAPRLIKNLDMNTKIGTVGVTRDPADGRYLFALGGSFLNDDGVRFVKSVGTTLDEQFALDPATVFTWTKDNDPDIGDRVAWDQDSWQYIGFVRDVDGTLAIITMSDSDSVEIGIGRTRLWRVVQTGRTFDLDLWASRDLGMKEPTTGDMDAGAGVYVSPSGQLLLYVCEHLSNGPGDSIRMGEFRTRDMNVPADCGCNGWITLYENTVGWNDRNSQSHVVDFQDYAREEWYDLRDYEDHAFDLNGFSDEAESVRWNIPPGRIGQLFRDENYTGGVLTLDGTGRPMRIDNLADNGFDDEITSVRFVDRPANMYVTPGTSCIVPGGLGTQPCPFFGPASIQRAADRIGAPPCFSAQTIYLAPGNYTQDVFIDRPMTLTTSAPGAVTIFGQ